MRASLRLSILALGAAMAASPFGATAQPARPSDAALIAAAKRMPMGRWATADYIERMTVEGWLRAAFGPRPAIRWRAGACRIVGPDKASPVADSPICVEAHIAQDGGAAFTLGIGFDEKRARPQDHPVALWGVLSFRGKACEFARRPDALAEARGVLDDMRRQGKCL